MRTCFKPLIRFTLSTAATVLLPSLLAAQAGTGSRWTEFGPYASDGAFPEITSYFDAAIAAYAVAVDPQNRVLTLSAWKDNTIDLNRDCAVTRRLRNARGPTGRFSTPRRASAS